MSRLLIVDDDADILDCLQAVLEERHEVVCVAGGREAVAEASATKFDVIILDLMMPVMDGVAVITELRSRGIDVPIVLASAAPELAKRAAELQLIHFVSKPFDFDTLDAKIAAALESGAAIPRSC